MCDLICSITSPVGKTVSAPCTTSITWLPKFSNVSLLQAIHSEEGSNSSLMFLSPSDIDGFLINVISKVDAPLFSQAVPGSSPTLPTESITSSLCFKTIASSPL